jgi:hypothetical protein
MGRRRSPRRRGRDGAGTRRAWQRHAADPRGRRNRGRTWGRWDHVGSREIRDSSRSGRDRGRAPAGCRRQRRRRRHARRGARGVGSSRPRGRRQTGDRRFGRLDAVGFRWASRRRRDGSRRGLDRRRTRLGRCGSGRYRAAFWRRRRTASKEHVERRSRREQVLVTSADVETDALRPNDAVVGRHLRPGIVDGRSRARRRPRRPTGHRREIRRARGAVARRHAHRSGVASRVESSGCGGVVGAVARGVGATRRRRGRFSHGRRLGTLPERTPDGPAESLGTAHESVRRGGARSTPRRIFSVCAGA